MKKKKNSIAILGMGLLLVLAYAIPMIVTFLEDRYLQAKRQSFKIEEIKLNSKEVNLEEELMIFPELLAGNIIVRREEEEIEESYEYAMVRQNVEEFLLLLNEENTPKLQEFSIASVVMATTDNEHAYPLWRCGAKDNDENEYIFWLDEMSGKVMGFEIPISIVELTGEEFYKLTVKLAGYYGFTIQEEAYEVSLEKEKYWDGAICFWIEKEGIEIILPLYKYGDYLSFNTYPGKIPLEYTNTKD